MKYVLLYCCLLFTVVSNAQRQLPEYGKIEKSELEMKSCSFESDANAMILFDEYEIDVTYVPATFYGRNFSSGAAEVKTERRVRMKIFNEKGFKHASIRIPYFAQSKRTTKMKKMSAVVYNLAPNGEIISNKLEGDDFFREKIKDNQGMLTFTFPNLKAGSVIEYRYTLIERNTISIDPWFIQRNIPVAYSCVRLQTPTELLLRDYPLGIDSIGRTTEFIRGNKYRITRYFMADVPSFQMEPLMSSHKDYLRRMVYSLTPGAGDLFQPSSDPEKTWLSYGDRLRYALDEDFKKPIAGTEGLIDSANKLNTNTEKIAFVYSSLRKRFARKNEQTLKPESGGLEEAWKTQSANSAELNLLLLYLLRKSGVESYPLLISTRENGHVNRKYPSISQFNGIDVLALDSTQFFLLDASIPYQSYLNPPLNVLNREGLVLSDNVQWVGISDSRYLQRTSTAVFAAINIDDKLEGVVDGRYFDYSKSYRLDSTLKEDEDEELEKKPIGLEIISVKEENRDAEGEPLIERTEFKYEMNNTGDFYFIRPGFLSKDNKNPFTKEKRTTDIDLGCNQQHIFSLNLDVPEGWEVESFPNNKIIRAPDSSFFYRRVVEKSGNRLYYNYTFEINRALFNSDEYDGVRQFFNLVYSAIEEEIVLKKKKK